MKGNGLTGTVSAGIGLICDAGGGFSLQAHVLFTSSHQPLEALGGSRCPAGGGGCSGQKGQFSW